MCVSVIANIMCRPRAPVDVVVFVSDILVLVVCVIFISVGEGGAAQRLGDTKSGASFVCLLTPKYVAVFFLDF